GVQVHRGEHLAFLDVQDRVTVEPDPGAARHPPCVRGRADVQPAVVADRAQTGAAVPRQEEPLTLTEEGPAQVVLGKAGISEPHAHSAFPYRGPSRPRPVRADGRRTPARAGRWPG